MRSESFLSRMAPVRPRLLATGAAVLLAATGCGGYGDGYNCYACGPPVPTNVPNSIAIADLNGDGVPDLAVATTLDQGLVSNPGFANIILNSKTAPGTFDTGVQYSITGGNPSGIVATDLTGSGNLDLVISNFGTGSISVFMHGATPGTYMPALNIVTGGQPNQVVAGDLTGSGSNRDLVLADNSPAGNAIVLVHDAANPGQFLAPIMLATNGYTPSVAVGTIATGQVAVVAATYDVNGNNGVVTVFVETSTNPVSFAAAVTYPAGAQPQAVRIADVNGDGLPDLVVANLGPGSDGAGMSGVSVLLQDATRPGTFLAPAGYQTPFGAVDVAVGDLNGDGKPDLVVASYGPFPTGAISVLLQNAATPGTFGTATVYAGFGQPLSVAIADLNGDGHPDIAAADGTSATVMLQNAAMPGTFANPVQVGN
ncbi:MAG TPA: VCBS repeat-containing protein [Steroidobacteraceae bacterium]|nr:VCBS repeat-containing protein [Gammaproteobacteria bacterium]HEV2285379.1 VCBS repeat-containing protein [Steroidobacteraceae bacterium]